ncbi:MAG: substrate-binding domain-containing protein [Kiritimatiellae bacterium]|nr:substrate-binding domain-containing protein [Kiritimatiellia bacterium]
MNTILVFTTSSGRARTDMLAGVREFAKDAEWNIQTFEYEGKPFPVRRLLDFWKPIGCITEVCGNVVASGFVSIKTFGRTPVVFLGSESYSPTGRSVCVIHDAKLVSDSAAMELMSIGMTNFAFVGASGKGWSHRRKVAFEEALKLNGHGISTMDVHPTSAVIYARDSARLKSWLLSLPKPCGIMAADDEIAATVLSICRQAKIDVPNDVAVVGVDDNESLCMDTMPTLSSVRPDFRQGGRFAARILARMLRGGRNIQSKAIFGVSGITRRGSTRVFNRKDAEVSAALERIWAQDGAALSPRDVLAGFSCSRRNAELRFRKATGRTVMAELVTARMARAKSLLSETILPIPEIAVQCGYRFPANFRDAFRAATGLNPLAWRKSTR